MTLSDTALMMLSAAARRDDHGIEAPSKLKGAAGLRLITKLRRDGLIEEVVPHGALPIWGRKSQGIALRVTEAGLAAIGVDEAGACSDSKHNGAKIIASSRNREDGGAGTGRRPSPKRTSGTKYPQPERPSKDDASGNGATQTASPQPALPQRACSKQAQVIGMLSRPEGATVAAIVSTTGWQKHSVRGFLSGAVRKRLGLTLISEVVGDERRYRIAGTRKPPGSITKARKNAAG